jgi:AcrR family transcriptional regulator
MSSPAAEAQQYYQELWASVQPETSRRLLMSALDCFSHKGFEGTTTREIAVGAGVSPAGLYVHYRTKSDLLLEICRIGHTSNWNETQTALSAANGPTSQLAAFVQSFVVWHARFHTLARVAQYELRSLSEDQLAVIREIRRNFQRTLEKILETGATSGEFDVDDPHGTARALLSLGIDVARWFTGLGELKPEAVGDLYVELALRMAGADRSETA